jgi:hypothetical protein
LLLTVVYFPNLPPNSPSISASAEREPFIMVGTPGTTCDRDRVRIPSLLLTRHSGC